MYICYIWKFPKMGVPKMDGLQWKILLKWMIRGTPTLGNLHNSMMCGFVQIAISGGVFGWDMMGLHETGSGMSPTLGTPLLAI
jgi:hypothetical protein